MTGTNSPQRPVVVVGMHRSGTSLAASILGSSGLHLGERLVPAAHGNPEGHFEDLEFHYFHRAAFQTLGLSSEGWDEVVIDAVPDVFEAKARALIAARSSQPLWGWKDPRTTLFLPFWERLLPEARFVFVYRGPWEVIDSLYRRGDERFRRDPRAAARLWSHYNRVILDAFCRNRTKAVLFRVEDMATDPRAFVEDVSRAFGLHLKPPGDVVKPDLLRRGGSLADWRTLSESVLSSEVGLLKRLDEAAHRLPGSPPDARCPEAPDAGEGALLRQWVALRAVERERDDFRASGTPRRMDAQLQLFTPARGAYSGAECVVDILPADGRTRDYTFLVPYDGSAPLRIDTGESVGLVELESLTVRARETGLAASWAGRSLESAPIRLANAIRIGPGQHASLCFLNLNDDPQVYVDLPDRQSFRGECQVDIRIGFRAVTDEALQRAAAAVQRELSAATAENSLLRAQLTDATARLQNETTIEDLRRRVAEVSRVPESGASTVGEVERRSSETSERRLEARERLKSSESTIGEFRRRLLETSDRWREASRALRFARRRIEQREGELEAMAEQRERATRRGLELDRLREALAKAESSLGRVSRAVEALQQSRAYRLGHRILGPWRRVRSVALALRGASSPSASELDLARLADTPLFDADYYLTSNADVRVAELEPRTHYLSHGAGEGRDPSPWFSTAFYLARYPDVAASGMNPLLHYLKHGAAERRVPTPWFDPAFYLDLYPDVLAAGMDPFVHYLRHGAAEGRVPNPWFDPQFYLAKNPDVAAAGVSPLLHYLAQGARQGRAPNPWFDPVYYLAANPNVADSGVNPLEHFIAVGLAEGRPPNATFDRDLYLAANPDVVGAGGDALRHYVTIGCREGRPTSPAALATDYSAMKREIARQKAAASEALQAERPTLVTVPVDEWFLVAESLAFDSVEKPVVSIVIPAFNQAGYTLECLTSLSRTHAGVPFEVILFDNASTDATSRLFGRVPNLRYVRSQENLGFVLACNRAAELARGEFVLFLNNDAQVTAGWLSALVDTFGRAERVGAVGPKILFPDGRLQEAGGHVTPDARTEMVGLFEDPDEPRYNYVREVAYCSGVCLIVPTARFRELGGFDPDLAPAYCEDVDLCLRLRTAGLRVVYNPESVIVHHLSVTSSSLDEGFKLQCVARNEQRLVERHHELLDELNRVRLIAFYLPQFHPIPENDRWWGKGFTEWRNVARARPNFEGHDQPRLPADMGFYDLRLPEVMTAQAALARRYGVHGFCYYYYWFAGTRLLETPLEMRLRDRDNDFPFCLAWANENWTRTWDGMDEHVLIGQQHSDEDDEAVIRDLLRYVEHPAYIRIAGRPLLVVYRAALFPNVRRTVDIWRDVARKSGVGELYLAVVESFEQAIDMDDPALQGFDASVEFPPHNSESSIEPPGAITNPRFRGRVHDYRKVVLRYLAREQPVHTRFRTVMPGWDNTPRRQDDPEVFAHSSPGAYRAWLEAVIHATLHQNFGDERLVFINAWNEWAEGAFLEPDSRHGHAYLEATRDALEFGPLP